MARAAAASVAWQGERYAANRDAAKEEARARKAAGAGWRTVMADVSAEFGVSVLKKARGRGYGSRLFDRAVMHARNEGVELMFIHALSENKAMLKIARNAGATLERAGSDKSKILSVTIYLKDIDAHELVIVDDASPDGTAAAPPFIRPFSCDQPVKR